MSEHNSDREKRSNALTNLLILAKSIASSLQVMILEPYLFETTLLPHNSQSNWPSVATSWPVALLLLQGSDVTKHILSSGYNSRFFFLLSLFCLLRVKVQSSWTRAQGPPPPLYG